MSRFWRGRRVLLTGHTGFKGPWTALVLESLGAEVHGLALPPRGQPNLFELLGPWTRLRSRLRDIRDRTAIAEAVRECAPQVVIHMAAQAFVGASYRQPVETFDVNVMGTLHLLEAVSRCETAEAVLVITSDKVYENVEDDTEFREDDRLAGDDPYSASKAATELALRAWRASRRGCPQPRFAAARAGNVIGGGDWSEDRLVPHIVRAWQARRPVELRHPKAYRPWQHVLDVVTGYLAYAERLAGGDGDGLPPALNFGPPPGARISTVEMVGLMQRALGRDIGWVPVSATGPLAAEKRPLALDSALAREAIGWRPRLGLRDAVAWTAQWYAAQARGQDMRAFSIAQVSRYRELPA